MAESRQYPDTDVDIVSVKPMDNITLLVEFSNGEIKKYDVKQLFDKYPQFKALKDRDLFNDVKHGKYFVYWNSELDIAEVELWYNGNNDDINQYWGKALSILKETFSDVVYNTWIKPLTPFSYDNNIYVLKCDRDFAKNVICERYLSEITRCLKIVIGKDICVSLIS